MLLFATVHVRGSKNRKPEYGSQIEGLLSLGHSRKGHPTYRNSHMDPPVARPLKQDAEKADIAEEAVDSVAVLRASSM